MTTNKYLHFIEHASGSKTKLFEVCRVQNGARLGTIRWYSPWRRYVFYPEHDTLFDVACLNLISSRIHTLMTERATT